MRRLSRSRFVLLFCAWAGVIGASSEAEELSYFRLSNGLQVVVLEGGRLSLVAADLYVNSGSADESEQQAGAAHMVEHLFFRTPVADLGPNLGLTSLGPGWGVGEALESLGVEVDAQTTRDFTHYYFDAPTSVWPTALRLLATAAFRLRVEQPALELEKSIILSELRALDSATTRLENLLYAAAFGKRGYGPPPGGDEASIRDLTTDKVQDYYAAHYKPNNMLLVLVGNLRKQAALDAAQEVFGGQKEWPLTRAGESLPAHLPNLVRSTSWDKSAYVAVGWLAPPATASSDLATLDVLRCFLGEGESPFVLTALARRGISAVQGGASFLTHRYPSLFWVWAKTPSEAVDAAHTAISQLSADLQAEWPSAAAVAQARDTYRAIANYAQGSCLGQAATLGFHTSLGLPSPQVYLDQVDSVTSADLCRAAKRYLQPQRAVAVLLE